jgi:hypothetical protein
MPNVGGCDRGKVIAQGAFVGNHKNSILWFLGIIWGFCGLREIFEDFVGFWDYLGILWSLGN